MKTWNIWLITYKPSMSKYDNALIWDLEEVSKTLDPNPIQAKTIDGAIRQAKQRYPKLRSGEQYIEIVQESKGK